MTVPETKISLVSATFDRETHVVHVHAVSTHGDRPVPMSFTFDWHHPRLEAVIEGMAEALRAAMLDAMTEAIAGEPLSMPVEPTVDVVHPCRSCREPVHERDGVVVLASGPHESDRWYHREHAPQGGNE